VHANTRGRAHTVIRPRRTAGALLALALAAGACSSGSEAGPDGTDPTFARAEGASLAFEEPVASVSDLVAPRAEGDEWTIVGSVFEPESAASVATVWTSDDARGWEPSTVDPASSGTGETMNAAVATEGGLVAVGQVEDGAEADAAVWRQVDGEWRRALPEAMAGEHEQWAFDVVAGESGILVAGGENVWGEVRPRLWFSPDGETWTSVDGGAGGPLDGTGEESVRDVAAAGAGFVAVGSRRIDNEQDGLVWYSADGQSWEQVSAPTLGGSGRQEVMTVAATDAGPVAGGYSDADGNGQGDPVIWRSADGRTWTPASGALPMTDRRNSASDLAVRSISLAPQGLIAAGGNDWRPRVWHSTDNGKTWNELANPVHGELFQSGVSLVDAEGVSGLTVALGSEPSVLLLAGSRWQDATGETFPQGGTQPFATSVATGADATIAAGGRYTAPTGEARENYTGQVWRRSGDGWDPVDSETLSAGHVMDTAPFAGGFVAVGFEDFGVADKRDIVGDSEPDGLLWVSPNGREWARIGVQDARINEEWLSYLNNPSPEQASAILSLELEAPPLSVAPAGGTGTRSLSAVSPLGEGFIAVGSVYDRGDANPIIVTSPDGTSYVGEDPIHTGRGIQRYNDVCVAPDGTAVAVGVSGSTGAYDVIVGARVEGEGWVAGEGTFTGDGDQQAYACGASEDGFVLVGSDDRSGNVDARVWTSEDGVTWTELESSLLGGSGDQWASAVAAVPDGGWLVGGTDTAAGDGDIALWRIDGGELTRRDRGEPALAGPGEQSVTNIAIDEDGTVTLAGNDYGRAGLWESDSVDR
jgi:WD40 repeat protein